MIKFDKPKRSEYPQIVNLVNSTDQIYLNIYSPQEFKEFECASESIENLVEGEKNREYLCAFDENNSIIGYSSFRLKNSQTMWLSMIYIDSKYQKKGYGSIFLKKIEELAKIFNSMVLVLETDKKAIWAVNFYKKNYYQILSDEDLEKHPFDKVMDKKQIEGRYIFGKKL